MSTEGLIIGFIVLLVSLAWVALPLRARNNARNASYIQYQKHHERLLMFYERVLNNIRDLDEDHSTGKMAENDYHAERAIWVQRGVQVLKTLDSLDEKTSLFPDVDEQVLDRRIDDEIEAAIAHYRTKAEEH